jgi:tungstate transport system ATP-binding protein
VYRGGALGYRRRNAVVFQEPLLFDTTVFGNVAAGLEIRGVPAPERARRAARSLERFRIAHLAGRSARTLSGGEAQRASLARAMALEPEILFLDEPFAALDPPAREALIVDLAGTLRETATTTVLVTHDRGEAVRLADRIAVLEDGRVLQIGPVREVLECPADEAVAGFLGVENILPGTVAAAEGPLVRVACGPATLVAARRPFAAGARVAVCIRPERVVLERTTTAETGANALPGRVTRLEVLGPLVRVTLDVGFPLIAFAPPPRVAELGLAEGAPVVASVNPEAVHLVTRAD